MIYLCSFAAVVLGLLLLVQARAVHRALHYSDRPAWWRVHRTGLLSAATLFTVNLAWLLAHLFSLQWDAITQTVRVAAPQWTMVPVLCVLGLLALVVWLSVSVYDPDGWRGHRTN